MKVIRKSVFETNSSSVHTLTVKSENKNLKADEESAKKADTFYLGFDWYEWGPDTLTTPSEKVSYLITAIWRIDGCEAFRHDDIWGDDAKELAASMNYVMQSKGMKMIEQAINDYFGKKINFSWEDCGTGHIDHQSIEDYRTFKDFLKENNLDSVDKLRDFIFDWDSYIIIDNDNH